MSLKNTIEERISPLAEKSANASDTPVIFDVAKIIESLYGYKPATIAGLPLASKSEEFNVSQIYKQKRTTSKGSPIYGMQDLIGREVFLPLTIKASGINYEFPFTIVGLKTKKLLVETPMIERGGSVIEEIGIDAWRISVKGFLVDALNQFPDDQLDKLNQMWRDRNPVTVKCALIDIFLEGNDLVVISNLEIPAKSKVIGVRDFSFELIQYGILNLESI